MNCLAEKLLTSFNNHLERPAICLGDVTTSYGALLGASLTLADDIQALSKTDRSNAQPRQFQCDGGRFP